MCASETACTCKRWYGDGSVDVLVRECVCVRTLCVHVRVNVYMCLYLCHLMCVCKRASHDLVVYSYVHDHLPVIVCMRTYVHMII